MNHFDQSDKSCFDNGCTDDCPVNAVATRRCSFCHAPPGQPCRTILYEEHIEHGGGKPHDQPHQARLIIP